MICLITTLAQLVISIAFINKIKEYSEVLLCWITFCKKNPCAKFFENLTNGLVTDTKPQTEKHVLHLRHSCLLPWWGGDY